MPDQRAGELIEHEELAAARGDGEVVAAEPPVEAVGVQPGRVDEVAGAQGAAGGVQEVAFLVPVDLPDGGVQVEFDTGADGLGGVGQGGGPGADDALAGNVQGAQGAGAEARLAGVQLVSVQPAGVRAGVERSEERRVGKV